ncbi:MAG: glycogen/starch/alpha-glucan phosphorylase [Desulfobacterales bacterium]
MPIRTKERLKVVFVRNFNVKSSSANAACPRIYPSRFLAGKEASGTGNMKFAMNGALTIGTLDGANVEIRDAVGAENFFLFGMNAQEVAECKAAGYVPREYYDYYEELREVIDIIGSGRLSRGDRDLFAPLVHSLLNEDRYMLMADYKSYIDCQEEVNRLWADQKEWTRRSVLNVARIGKFSSDRAIREYCRDIWKIEVP